MNTWEREQLEYRMSKTRDAIEGARLLGLFGLALLVFGILGLIFGGP